MRVSDLRALLSELPDDMPVAAQDFEEGFNALTSAVVLALAPTRLPTYRDGVLTENNVDWSTRKLHVALSGGRACAMSERFRAAGISGWFDPDHDEYVAFGWEDDDRLDAEYDTCRDG